MQLLVIDDGRENGSLLAQRLAHAGFRPHMVDDVDEALASVEREAVEAILLDHGRRTDDACASVRALREGGVLQPLMIISARDDWREKVACLDAGADEFLVKPVRSEEIAARLRAILRRTAGQASDRIVFGDIDLSLRQQCAWKAGRCLDLTRNEFRLLRLFLLNPDDVIAKEQIRDAVWGAEAGISDNAVEVQITRLRRKLGERSIKSMRGMGYRLIPDFDAADAAADCEPCRHLGPGMIG